FVPKSGGLLRRFAPRKDICSPFWDSPIKEGGYLDLKKLGIRALVTVSLGPFILFCAWKGGAIFLALVTSIVVLGMNEFYNLAAQKVTTPERITGQATGVVLCFLFYYNLTAQIWVLLSASLAILLIIELFRNETGPILNVATTLMGMLYVALLLAFLIMIRGINVQDSLEDTFGGKLVILLFLCIWVCDSAAYLLGSRFGKHKLFERVSPNKTVEGTVAGFVFALAAAYLCYLTFFAEIGWQHALAVGAICGSLGQLSDLLESLFKRDAKVKDSSNLIPGHGGILDRFDSEMLAAPAVYFYVYYLVS
ncbi:MAG: phosphatidate cytidylyltransferase, partial [bacterium]